jgi:hypothetical protein
VAQSPVRQLQWHSGQRIADQLLPDDQEVVITRDFEDAVRPSKPLTVRQVIDAAAVGADLVAVVDVGTVDTVLSLHDTWVDTRLIGTIQTILRTSKSHHFRLRQRIEAHVPGGEIVVAGVLVKAHDAVPVAARQLPAGRSYLLFLEEIQGVLYDVHAPVLVKGGKLTYPLPYSSPYEPPNTLEKLSLSEVTKMVRSAKTSWLLGNERR